MADPIVRQFCDVTQADPDTAAAYLEAAGYDLETAVAIFLSSAADQGSGGTPVARRSVSAPNPGARERRPRSARRSATAVRVDPDSLASAIGEDVDPATLAAINAALFDDAAQAGDLEDAPSAPRRSSRKRTVSDRDGHTPGQEVYDEDGVRAPIPAQVWRGGCGWGLYLFLFLF